MERPIEFSSFENTLRAAVRQRAIRYTEAHSLSLRWEADDTNAIHDAIHFQSILRLFSLPAAEELVLSSNDRFPAWTVQRKFSDLLSGIMTAQGRTLIIVHYAGHGSSGPDGSLWFIERQGGRKVNAERFLFSVVGPDVENVDSFDVLFIFDCCYGLIACRAADSSQRIVEIVAATTEDNPRAFAPPCVTVTANLVAEITRRQRDGHQYVEIADIVATLRANSTIKKPGHCLKLGVASICLPFTGLSGIDPKRIQPSLRAVFSVHINDNMTQEKVNQFLHWVRTLPEFASITLEGVYPTSSSCLILSAAWSVWSKLQGMAGYQLIAEARGPNTVQSPQLAACCRAWCART
jgi:hypothetical protein